MVFNANEELDTNIHNTPPFHLRNLILDCYSNIFQSHIISTNYSIHFRYLSHAINSNGVCSSFKYIHLPVVADRYSLEIIKYQQRWWCAGLSFKLWAEPSQALLGWAGLGPANGLTQLWAWPERFESWKPWAWATALVAFFWNCKGTIDGIFNLNHISEILPIPNIFTCSRRKLIGKTIVIQTQQAQVSTTRMRNHQAS